MPESTARLRRKLYGLLGRLPARVRRIRAVREHVLRGKSFERERLLLDLNAEERVPAFLYKPLNATGRLPVVLFNHSHGGRYRVGKREAETGAPYLCAKRSYAEDLTAAGFAVLAIDHWNFGERHRYPDEASWCKVLTWQGRVAWGMMVYDALRAVDYLCSRPDVDAKRIATLGMSMGATLAWWLGALDPRVKCVVDLCCMTDFQELIQTGGVKGHGAYYYVPDLLNHFDTVAINALIAPRAHLSMNGRKDPLTPPTGLRKIDRALKAAYKAAGSARAWKMVNHGGRHVETPAMRQRALRWLKQWL